MKFLQIFAFIALLSSCLVQSVPLTAQGETGLNSSISSNPDATSFNNTSNVQYVNNFTSPASQSPVAETPAVDVNNSGVATPIDNTTSNVQGNVSEPSQLPGTPRGVVNETQSAPVQNGSNLSQSQAEERAKKERIEQMAKNVTDMKEAAKAKNEQAKKELDAKKEEDKAKYAAQIEAAKQQREEDKKKNDLAKQEAKNLTGEAKVKAKQAVKAQVEADKAKFKNETEAAKATKTNDKEATKKAAEALKVQKAEDKQKIKEAAQVVKDEKVQLRQEKKEAKAARKN